MGRVYRGKGVAQVVAARHDAEVRERLESCAAATAIALLAACASDARSPQPAARAPIPVTAAAEDARVAGCDLEPFAVRRPGAARVVAIGDLHGDLEAARRALRLAGAIDAEDRWIGGDELLVVQTGDLIDRGDDEPEVLALFDALPILWLNGNHELMNAAGDYRYVTEDGMRDYGGELGRVRAYRPGGPEAKRLAMHDIVAIVGDTVFAHGGVLPSHVELGLDRLNLETRCWLAGQRQELPSVLVDERSPVWMRDYGMPPERCDLLDEVLRELGAVRMVVGHTTQRGGISSACDGKVWRIDAGLARFYGGPMEILEIAGGRVRVLGREP